MDRTEASDAFNAGSIPVGCIYITFVYERILMLKDKVGIIVHFISRRSKIVFPVVVIAAVALTVSVALKTGNAEKLEVETITAESAVEESVVPEVEPDTAMIVNEDAAVAELIHTMYSALASGDAEVLNSICDEISTQDMLVYQERAKYIESYPVLEIYTKPGPEAGSTIAFIYYKVVFAGHAEEFPGYTAHYICTDEQGKLYIKRGENSEEVNQYIIEVMAQDDVVEFNNRVNVEYKELMAEHPELLEYLSEMNTQVKAAVGTELAQVNIEQTQTPDNGDGQAPTDNTEGGNPEDTNSAPVEQTPAENVVQYASASTTVNVRSSDSEQADKLGKVSGGTRLQILEQKVNGWTKVLYEGKEGYIKSEFLELAESAEGMESIGTVTATTNINVRASASESADRLGVLTGGESAELLANENGWCKIKYNGQVGYVKADYVQ